MEVSFTKINDDILVPTHLFEAKDQLPLSAHSWLWWGFGSVWLLLAILMGFALKPLLMITGFLTFCVILFIVIMKLPYGWIELNRKDGMVTVWTSQKKQKRVAKGIFTDFHIGWTCRYMQTSKYSAEYRYSLGLYKNNETKVNKTFIDGNQKAQFCFLYDMATQDTKRMPESSASKNAAILTSKADTFLKDFFSGKPLTAKINNTFIITP